MKKEVTLLSCMEASGVRMVALALFFSTFFISAGFSQTADPKDVVGDIAHVTWKAPSDLDVAIAQEEDRMTVALNAANVPDIDQAIFKAYQHMLGHVQAELQASKPVDEAIFSGYNQTLVDARKDPELADLPEGALLDYIPRLVEALMEIPVMAPVVGQ